MRVPSYLDLDLEETEERVQFIRPRVSVCDRNAWRVRRSGSVQLSACLRGERELGPWLW